MQHKDVKKGNVHIIHNFEFTNVDEMNSYMADVEDLNKVALVNAPYGFYALKSIEPIEWKILGGVEVKVGDLDVYSKDEVEQLIAEKEEVYKSDVNPTITINPKNKGDLWVNFQECDIFMCMDNSKDQNIWQSIKTDKIISPKKIFLFDLFKDSSAVGLFELEANTLDNGNKSTLILNNMDFIDSLVGKGIKAKDETSKADVTGNIRSISFFAKLPNSIPQNNYLIDCRKYNSDYYCYLGSRLTIAGLLGIQIFQNGVTKGSGAQLTKNEWTHFLIIFNANVTGTVLLNYINDSAWGIPNAEIDQIRCFNRVITTAEIQKLREEIL